MPNTEIYQGLQPNEILSLRSFEVLIKEVTDEQLDQLLIDIRTLILGHIFFMDLSLDNPFVSALLIPVEFLLKLPKEFKMQAVILQRKTEIILKNLCLEYILERDTETDYDDIITELLTS